MSTMEMQEVLCDLTSSGKLIDWGRRKLTNEYVAMAYDSVDPAKASRLRDCASFLQYAVSPSGAKRLVNANFCRVRLCPICQWRKSLKNFGQMAKIMTAVKRDHSFGYIFLTLTVKNVTLSDLSVTIDHMMKSWDRMKHYKAFDCVKGWYRGFEVTHNLDRNSPSFDTFHPHIHVVIAVNASYFTDRTYVSRDGWVSMWRKAARLDYAPSLDVRRVKGDTAQAVAEVAKYAVKSKDYIVLDDWQMTVDTVAGLDSAFANRRFVAFGGIFGEYHKRLNLDDVDEGDLVKVGDCDIDIDGLLRVSYAWRTGYSQYVRVD